MDGPLDDDYVANLLKEDAKKANQSASLIGMRAYMPQKTNAEAPKPNKRFLRNIIRETNSHNQALLAKEAEESRVRLKDLRESEAREARKLANEGRSPRDRSEERHRKKRRRLDVIARDSNRLSPPQDFEILESRRDRSEERSIPSRRSRREDDNEDNDDERSTRKAHKRAKEKNDSLDQAIMKSFRRAENLRRHRSRSRNRSDSGEDSSHRKSARPDRHSKSTRHDRSRGRSASPERSRERERSHRKSRQKRSPSRSRSRSRSKERSHRRKRNHEVGSASKHTHSSLRHSRNDETLDADSPRPPALARRSNRWDVAPSPPTAIVTRASRARPKQQDSDSDPLEDIVGPIPPQSPPAVKVRGRGAISSSAMDSHFSASYNPHADVEPEVGPSDDWEMALEAMRDRAKFKQTQGDRLRAAGFTEDEIKKWEKGSEKTEEDVRWVKKGEGREWDRGKVVDEATGHVETAPEWGRLKGT
ncbi:hypothetical protein FKW77_008689 [Venturia effusa]|uniref:Pre-mRNA-splicing factor 38B n=1 Tax=Venturia effusa TaxID=50376 RepID=A0A517LBH7_9PEZI|nr:hypothetical protein FKW77_008689 [Venturia effusa]